MTTAESPDSTELPGSPDLPGLPESSGGAAAAEEIPRFISCDTDALRDALRALGVPEELLTIRWVRRPEELDDDSVPGTPLSAPEQYTALLALLHRVATTLRANRAAALGYAADEGEREGDEEQRRAEAEHLALDHNCAWTADSRILVGGPHSGRSREGREHNRAEQLSRACEETRWLAQGLHSLTESMHTDAKEAQRSGEPDVHQDKVPAPLFVARTLARCVWSLTMVAYMEHAIPDAIDSDEAALLGMVLHDIRASTAVLLRYGTGRGLLQKVTDEKGRAAYEVVTDIVAAASGGTGRDTGADTGGEPGGA